MKKSKLKRRRAQLLARKAAVRKIRRKLISLGNQNDRILTIIYRQKLRDDKLENYRLFNFKL